MALDWNRQITFGRGKRADRSSGGLPGKTYINLAANEERHVDVRRTAILAVVLVVAVALFAKFGVFDFQARVSAKAAELSGQQQVLSALEAKVADYDEVLATYESYESASIVESGLVVDALDALSLVDRCVTPYARVASLTLSVDTMQLNLARTSLDKLGQLVSVLEQQDMVSRVLLSTAGTATSADEEATGTVTITLQPVEGEGGEA